MKFVYKHSLPCLAGLLLASVAFAQTVVAPKAIPSTICNPINLSYRFCLDTPSRREAADPTMILYKGSYYLFASKSGGYFQSDDLINWKLITTNDLPLEDYAPAAVVLKDTLYFMASANPPFKIYKTTQPALGKWEVANPNFPIGMIDPDLFIDDDGKLYFYYGCSDVKPIYGVELNTQTLNPIGEPIALFNSNHQQYGWERKGDFNNLPGRPWIEGSWMTKHDGKYYLQYAGPGTEFKSYSDAVYVSDHPLGPFQLANNSPFSYKPTGFVAGAGHGSTFQDKWGNYWHIATMTISQKHMFERRLGLFPTFFDEDGVLHTYTGIGDFPFKIPNKKISQPEELFPGWMLLSYNKRVKVSSLLPEHPSAFASDEEVRTYWSAQTGNKGEWISMDLQKEATIHAIQINYAENKTTITGRNPNMYYQYLLEYSTDQIHWKTAVDKTNSTIDAPHDYIELSAPIQARYVRLTNYHVPDGTFALADLRVFGTVKGRKPSLPINFKAIRSATDRCVATLRWNRVSNAVGYNIRFGTAPDKLYQTYQVLGNNTVSINSLNSTQPYFFTIDAFNETGVTKGNQLIQLP